MAIVVVFVVCGVLCLSKGVPGARVARLTFAYLTSLQRTPGALFPDLVKQLHRDDRRFTGVIRLAVL